MSLHFAVMPNPPRLQGTMLTLSMGDFICLSPTLSSLPLHLTPHTFTMQHVAAHPPCHLTFTGQLVTMGSPWGPRSGKPWRWFLAGQRAQGFLLSSHPMVRAEHQKEHQLPSVLLHPHRDLAPCEAAVHDLQQNCGVEAGRGGIPSATCPTMGATHKWLIPPFPAVFFCQVSLPTNNSLLWLSSPE